MREEVKSFQEIYRQKLWGSGTLESPLSGLGSNPDQAAPYVQFVKECIQTLNVSKVLDYGHGDWAMWRDYKFDGIDYVGIDVVPELTDELRKRYGSPNKTFICQENKGEHLPTAELLISKDVLQHLSQEDIKQFQSKLNGYEYLVICNDYYLPSRILDEIKALICFRTRMKKLIARKTPFFPMPLKFNNSRITAGDFRGINLEGKLFSRIQTDYKLVSKFDYRSNDEKRMIKRVYFFERKRA